MQSSSNSGKRRIPPNSGMGAENVKRLAKVKLRIQL